MTLRIRSKVWVENEEGRLVMGTGRLRIPQAIMEADSINKAALKVDNRFVRNDGLESDMDQAL
jgi:molybdenum-dependent DNA-binding transcriptional regulator ModE